jgi:hypothetical protein
MNRIVQRSSLGAVDVAKIMPPSKDNKRFTAEVNGVVASGDTIEEACDNVSEALYGPSPVWL